jgi:hypothetical protein
MAARLVNRQARADGRGRRLLDQIDLARASLKRGIAHGALLDLSDARRDADDHPGPVEDPGSLAPGRDLPRALDEVLQHPLGHIEIGDDAVLQRAQRLDVLRRAAEHRLGLVTHPDHLVVGAADRDDRRLIEDDASAPHEHECVGRSEVDRQVRREEPKQTV